MPKIKFSERIKRLIGLKPASPIVTADEPEEFKPIELIKPGVDIEPPKPVKPREYDK